MNNAQEKSTQRLTDEICAALGDLNDYPSNEDRRKYFKEAIIEALDNLTKAEVTDILSFVLEDYELFFDIFEQSAQRSTKNESQTKSPASSRQIKILR
jgi:hypothetical protein